MKEIEEVIILGAALWVSIKSGRAHISASRDPSDPEDRTRYYDIHYQTVLGGIAAFSSTLALVDRELSQATLLDTDDLTSFAKLS